MSLLSLMSFFVRPFQHLNIILTSSPFFISLAVVKHRLRLPSLFSVYVHVMFTICNTIHHAIQLIKLHLYYRLRICLDLIPVSEPQIRPLALPLLMLHHRLAEAPLPAVISFLRFSRSSHTSKGTLVCNGVDPSKPRSPRLSRGLRSRWSVAV